MIAFAAISSQWRTTPSLTGGIHYIGLDYSAARAGLDLAGIEVSQECWAGVRVMEREALIALNRGK